MLQDCQGGRPAGACGQDLAQGAPRTVDEFMFKEGVQDRLNKLDEDLVGRVAVKKHVKEIATLLILNKLRCKLRFKTSVSFTCAPGTGKTTVAVCMGHILVKMVRLPWVCCPCHLQQPHGPVRQLHGPQDQGYGQKDHDQGVRWASDALGRLRAAGCGREEMGKSARSFLCFSCLTIQ